MAFSTSIGELPDEVLHIIASYLEREDIESCFNVCQKWRYIFDANRIWKIHCLYPEKYLKKALMEGIKYEVNSDDKCLWRQYYECQTRLIGNWNIGRFKKENSGIVPDNISNLYSYLDEHGNHWLFGNGTDGIKVWNMHGVTSIQTSLNHTDHIGIWPIKDKLITVRSDYIKVFLFKYPNYKLDLEYRFMFSMENILPESELVSEDYYTCSVRYIIINNIFVGYSENITNVQQPVLHIWDLESAKKIVTESVFQQSFADYVFSSTGSGVIEDFIGALILFEGGSDSFLVNLIDCRFNLCQISLYSLVQMRFVKVIAQVKSRTAWCFMKNNVVAVYHMIDKETSQISLYDVDGHFLGKLDFPYSYNPYFSGNFWFSGSKVILKVNFQIHVLTIKKPVHILTTQRPIEVCNHSFLATRIDDILTFFEPKYLLLFSRMSCSISVWDIESGVELYSIGKLKWDTINTYRHLLQNTEYPGKLILHILGDKELSILNFEI